MNRLCSRIVGASALAALALASVACVVPATRYDEARSALRLEQRANRELGARLYTMESKVASLQADLDKRQHDIDARDESIAQGKLDTSIAARKGQDASELVDQLRGELERVGDHLRAFADQKQELSEALDAADARIKRLKEAEHESSERAMVVRDLSLLLRDPIATGEVELSMDDGRPVLRVPSARVFDDKGGVRPEAKALIDAVARASRLHPGSNVAIAERGRSDGETDEQSTLRLKQLSDALSKAGLDARRVTLEVPKSEPPKPSDTPHPAAAAKAAPDSSKASLPASATIEIVIA